MGDAFKQKAKLKHIGERIGTQFECIDDASERTAPRIGRRTIKTSMERECQVIPGCANCTNKNHEKLCTKPTSEIFYSHICQIKSNQIDGDGIIQPYPFYSEFELWKWVVVDPLDAPELLPLLEVDPQDGSVSPLPELGAILKNPWDPPKLTSRNENG